MRSAFTLIEMLVVLAIMTALLSLVALVAPRFGERQRPSRGASQLQSWLNLAKNRALARSAAARHSLAARHGTVVGPNSFAYVTELQYIELPEVFTGGQLWTPYSNSSSGRSLQLLLPRRRRIGDRSHRSEFGSQYCPARRRAQGRFARLGAAADSGCHADQ